MPKKDPKGNLSKHTLLLFDGDYSHLQSLYPEQGAAYVIRRIVRKYLNELEEKAERMNARGIDE